MKAITLMLAGLIAFCGQINSQELQLVPIQDLSQLDLDTIMQGNHPELCIELPAKTIFPMHFFLRGNLLRYAQEPAGQIEIQQTFYMRCIELEPQFSTDLIEWKPFVEFVTGTVTMRLIIENGLPIFKAGAEIDFRE